ncbi:hypothetical protein M422DRAFT_252275 [Sphaerobolus stellatus SS14]|uniref:SAPS-domain-containing protein n=1 Tax=Sphaerobolus stellatus (strain SS14) TaxID=990650 RepID=A0A0C9W052_SPHS4|nr:hypothetical protein M422DRAFT_252275 [Sphaerobolus stellatus SS14]
MNAQSEEGRDVLEQTMKEMVDRMGVVHLGALLECFCERLDGFQELLRSPRSLNGPVSTTVGQITPLTTERFRICELYAELLHCSNMALLNRVSGNGPLYDDEGRLQGGLSALEELARVISTGSGDNNISEDVNDDSQEMVEARELPVHSLSSLSARSTDSSSLASDSDSELSDNSSDDALEDIAVSDHTEPPFPIRTRSRELLMPSGSEPPATPSSQENELGASNTMETSQISSSIDLSLDSDDIRTDIGSRGLPIGDVLKQRFMEAGILGSLLDLFFQFPWNNFLHGTVYDLVHQVLTGRVDSGLNRAMIVSLFRDAKLFHRIVDGHDENDRRSQQPKSVRLGYMGHLTLISEDIIAALEHYPEDLATELRYFAPQPEWDHYVDGGYKETKKRDTSLLGGGKPVIAAGNNFQKGRWGKVDEEDVPGSANGLAAGLSGKAEAIGAVVATSALHGEFKRTTSSTAPRNTADFGPSQEEEEATPSQFATILFGR